MDQNALTSGNNSGKLAHSIFPRLPQASLLIAFCVILPFVLPELLNEKCRLTFIVVCFFLCRVTFAIATFTNSDVTDPHKFRDSLEESFRDMKSLLLASKL